MEAQKDRKRLRLPFRKHLPGIQASDEGNEQSTISHRLEDSTSSSSRWSLRYMNPRYWRDASKATDGRTKRSQNRDSIATSEARLEAAPPALSPTNGRYLADEMRGTMKLSLIELDVSREIWNDAYDRLKRDQPVMVEIYEKILSSHLGESAVAQVTMDTVNCFVNCTTDIRLKRMEELTKKSLKQAENHSAREGEILAAVDVVKGIAGFIGSFVAAYPPAAMALSGVSTVLTVLVKPLQETRDMVTGLEYAMEVSERHMALCRLLLRQEWHTDSEFQEGREIVKARVTSLYVAVLTYQMKCVCHCYHDHPIMASIKAILGRINWKSEMEIVRVREEGVQSDACLYNKQVTVEFLRAIKSDAHELPQISHLLERLNRSIQDANLARILKEKEEHQRYQSELTGRFNVTSYEDQMKVNSLHVEGTCEWFRAHSHFRQWLDSDSDRILLVSANPGCGKSVLANYLINNVIPDEKPEATICYYFFKDNAEQSELSNAYSAIIHTLFLGNGKLADECKFDIEQAGLNLTKRPASLWKIFSKAVEISHAGPVVCILDALDECNPEGLRILVENLVWLYKPSRKTADTFDVRFLLTTRGYPAIIDRFNTLHPFCVRLAGENKDEAKAIQKEIDMVVEHRLNKLASKRRFGKAHKERLGKCIKRRGGEQRTYIWSSLVFEVLEGAYPDNNDRWEELVNNLPRTAYAAYAKLLERVQPQEKKRVTRLLHLILVAFRPLSLREMNVALNVHNRPGSDSIDDLNMVSDEAFRDWIVNTCGFFVTEYGGKVYFIHQTAKEFLLGIGDGGGEEKSNQEAISSVLLDKFDLASAHASMAESCISYLSLRSYRVGTIRDAAAKFVREMKRDSQDWESDGWKSIISHPFAEYVIRFWLTHFRHAQRFKSEDQSTDVEDGYVRHYISIFEDFELQHPGIFAMLRAQSITTLCTDPVPESSDNTENAQYDSCLLFFTDKLGIANSPVDTAGAPNSHSAGALAALFGHIRVLRDKVDPLTASRNFGIWGSFLRIPGQETTPDPLPIMSATIGRSIPCLEYVISRGIHSDFQGRDGWTPMHWAAHLGYPDVVECLLEHRLAVDGCNHDNQTPLLVTLASSNAHLRDREAVARLLILGSYGRKANLRATTANGHTPLHLAVQHNWSHADKRLKGVERRADMSPYISSDALGSSLIKLLVDNGADINAVDGKGQTPLMLACSNGRWESVACLLYSGADPNKPHSDGRSLLVASAQQNMYEYRNVAMVLLEHGANPDAKIDDTGTSLLHFLCASDSSGMLLALLRHGARVSAKDKSGRTPIQIAARKEFRFGEPEKTIVQLLDHGADPNEPERPRYLDRSWNFRDHAPTGSYEALCMTPLHWACLSSDSFLIRRLLDYGADPTAVDSNGRTPLHLVLVGTIKQGFKADPWVEKSILLLLKKGESSRLTKDKNGETPVDLINRYQLRWIEKIMSDFDVNKALGHD